MPRKSIRDFSGGLVTYQSELDLADNQFQSFDNIVNTKRGSVVKAGNYSAKSASLASVQDTTTEFLRYRTEKDGSNNDTSTQWWVVANNEIVSRADVASGTGGSWATVNTYSGLGSECITEGALTGAGGGDEWAFGSGWEYTTSPPLVASYGGSAAGAMTQTSAAMAIALEKNQVYKLQFTLVSLGAAGKTGITIKNQGLTETYVAFGSYTAATHTVYFSPQTGGGGIGFYAADLDGSATETFRINTVTIKECAKHDLLIHNQILRISDGSFNSSNDSKWYGHIKRNFFGGGITYGTSSDGYKFRQPPMAVAKNAWVSEKTELTAPTVVPMKYAFDQNNDVDAANEVGIFVHFPAGSGNDLELIPSVAANTFNDKDKYTVTFIYDYVQESELGRDANGDIGVYAQNAVSGGGEHCPGIQLVPFTNTSGNFTGGTGWNQRITGINLYWQPEDDIDWYLVTTYDCDEGFSEDPRAKDSATDTVLRSGATEKSNNGYWIPCMEPYGASGDDYENINASTANTFTEKDGTSSWGTAFSANNMVFVYPDDSITSLADVAGKLKETSTIICNIRSVTGTTLTTGITSTSVSWKNWSGEGHSETPFSMGSARAFVATVSTDKVATWYIPNDGLKLATYNSLTGRASETRLKPIKWNTSAVVGNKAFYANIDFKDENDQTLREKNRIVFTDNFKLDEAVVGTKFVDVGKNDGDEITALHSAQGRLYVFKSRNIYIYRIQSSQSVNFILERHIAGVGCLHKHAVVDTPYGICFADHRQVSLIRGTELSELSLLIRDTYQGLDLEVNRGALALGYHPLINTLVVNYSYDAVTMYAYNFDTQSWSKFTSFNNSGKFQSQFAISDDQELQSFNTSTNRVESLFRSNSNDSASVLLLKTKRYDFGLPEKFKRFTKLYVTYQSSSGTNAAFKIYIDGDDTEVMTESMDSHTLVKTYSAVINQLGKTIEVEVYGPTSNIRIDGIDIDYDIEGSNP
jgi:hypothetical protein